MGLEAMSTEPAAAVSRDVYSVIVSYSFNFAVVSSVAAIAEQSSRKLSQVIAIFEQVVRPGQYRSTATVDEEFATVAKKNLKLNQAVQQRQQLQTRRRAATITAAATSTDIF